ncbi:hypothetical protein ACJIZ3_018296 [Penstemon smallii]|uniref:Uncharacterized protein n=1 Tax=Penstemon smallii TaxID=265156 RepID=A0ABD3SXZ5_9LAMI
MGSCVSVHKDPGSALKLRFSVDSKNEKLLIPSPVKAKPDMVNGGDLTVADVVLKSQWSPARFGSKEETFFDSQPWIESDCEDDFFSVNGDFTPSRGSTPVHHNFSTGKLQVSKPPNMEGTINFTPELPSPPEKKKRLSELFKESLRSYEQIDVENVPQDKNVTPANETPYLSGANSRGSSSERTPNGVLKTEGKSVKSAQCCLPRLLSSRSFSERKKKTSPAHSVG